MGGFGVGPFGEMPFGMSSSLPGAPFLVDQFGPGGRIAVEVAWGADLTAAYDTWTWTDITADVYVQEGINLNHGRQDEADSAQPAKCSLVLDNSTAAYSLGGQSPNWPNVRQNTPVRVRVDRDTGLGFQTLFIGYADSWTPGWDQSANVATVQLTASGVLRRLLQNSSPVLSSLRRYLTSQSNVVAYWPLEEGKNATQGLSGVDGWPPMLPVGGVEFAADSGTFAASVQSVKMKNGTLTGEVPVHTTSTNQTQVRALVAFPENGTGMTDNGVLLRLWCASSRPHRIDVKYHTGAAMSVDVYDQGGNLVMDGGPVVFAMDGKAGRLAVEVWQDGTDVKVKLVRQPPLAGAVAAIFTWTVTSATFGRIMKVDVTPEQNHSGLIISHVSVQDDITTIFDSIPELISFDGETTAARFGRLCDENGLPHLAYGDGTFFDYQTDQMGPQLPRPLVELLNEVAAVDDGIIYDGLTNAGLTFRTRRAREAGGVFLTLSADQLAEPLEPVADDQGRLNRAIVTRQNGASAVSEDVDGPVGTAAIGVYDGSETLNVYSDEVVPWFASWLVHKGTVEGYRYPTLALSLARNPELASFFLQVMPGRRINLTDADQVATQHPAGTIALQVQGFEQRLTSHTWDVRLNCAPFDPWAVGTVADDLGDTDEFCARLDTDGTAVLSSSAAVGASTLTVTGETWTTNADDFPFDIEVAGIPVTVTSISGTGPQTFTVDVASVTKALPAGSPVSLWRPTVVGL